MKKVILLGLIAAGVALSGCELEDAATTTKEAKKVNAQQDQYAIGQPIPVFDWSLERDLLIKLYTLRNQKVVTHTVWRSDYGIIEGDCPSMGFGLAGDMSLTNPLATTDENQDGYIKSDIAVVEQPEPNGIFASKNTVATWVMCVGAGGIIEPHRVESKVTTYPGPVSVDYSNNRVTRLGKATVSISVRN